jgi:hypothetical protein
VDSRVMGVLPGWKLALQLLTTKKQTVGTGVTKSSRTACCMFRTFWLEDLKEEAHSRETYVNGKVLLTRILKK